MYHQRVLEPRRQNPFGFFLSQRRASSDVASWSLMYVDCLYDKVKMKLRRSSSCHLLSSSAFAAASTVKLMAAAIQQAKYRRMPVPSLWLFRPPPGTMYRLPDMSQSL